MPTLFTKGNVDEVLARSHPAMRFGKLKDGENVIVEEKDGKKLAAYVVNGRVVDWIGYDAKGNQVPTVVTRVPKKPGKVALAEEPKRYLVCVLIVGDFERKLFSTVTTLHYDFF